MAQESTDIICRLQNWQQRICMEKYSVQVTDINLHTNPLLPVLQPAEDIS